MISFNDYCIKSHNTAMNNSMVTIEYYHTKLRPTVVFVPLALSFFGDSSVKWRIR